MADFGGCVDVLLWMAQLWMANFVGLTLEGLLCVVDFGLLTLWVYFVGLTI